MKPLPLKCLILEDESLAQNYILALIEESEYLCHVATFDNVRAGRDFLKENNIDVIFLDLELSGNLSGIDLLDIFENKTDIPSIIISSGVRELIVDAVEFNKLIIGYLTKPFGKNKFHKLIEDNLEVLRATKNFKSTDNTLEQNLNEYLFWHTFDRKNGAIDVRINHKDIGYITVDGNYATFVLLNKERIVVQMSLVNIEKAIPQPFRYRINRDCILCNPACIERYVKIDRELMLHDGKSLGVGDIFRLGLKGYLDGFVS
jgi:two-component system, LytTR family, response regulator